MESSQYKFRAWDINKINVRKGSKGMYKQSGYVLAKAEYHPHCNSRGYVPKHRLLMENELGRYLKPRKELVHHVDGNRSNNEMLNLKLTTPEEHHIEEHYSGRNDNGQFVANEPKFRDIKYRLYDRDKNIIQIYSLQELISKTYRRAKFEYRGTFTGLKDKNGVEIYEGDVLKGHYWESGKKRRFIGQVKYARHSFFQKGLKQYFGMNQDFSPLNEVIGNIHEHPHLLSEVK